MCRLAALRRQDHHTPAFRGRIPVLPPFLPILLLQGCSLMPAFADSRSPAYDPLAVALPPATPGEPEQALRGGPYDLTVKDASRDREIPIRVLLPRGPGPAAVVLFSHGLGGSREGPAYLGRHWSARGYAVVALQHPGSDEAVWRGLGMAERLPALRAAASAENLLLRLGDVSAVLDQLERWQEGHDASSPPGVFAGRFDLTRVGLSGHSFGAQTTQAIGGQSLRLAGQRYRDARVKAAVIMSPGTPGGVLDPGDAFSGVRIPWLLMTGTRDASPIGGQTVESRLAVFPALPGGPAYQLVLDGAQHSAFGDRILPGETLSRNPNHHRAILAISTAFWDAFLQGEPAARAWVDGAGVGGVLEPRDRFERK